MTNHDELAAAEPRGEIILSDTVGNETPTDHEMRLAEHEAPRPEPEDEDA